MTLRSHRRAALPSRQKRSALPCENPRISRLFFAIPSHQCGLPTRALRVRHDESAARRDRWRAPRPRQRVMRISETTAPRRDGEPNETSRCPLCLGGLGAFFRANPMQRHVTPCYVVLRHATHFAPVQNEPTVAASGTFQRVSARQHHRAVDAGLPQLTAVDAGLPPRAVRQNGPTACYAALRPATPCNLVLRHGAIGQNEPTAQILTNEES